MRRATVLVIAIAASACTDLRDYRGSYGGVAAGGDPLLHVNIGPAAVARLDVAQADTHALSGTLSIDGLADHVPVASLPSADADVLAHMSLPNSPLRVYLAFVPLADGGGDAMAMIALYDSRRIELRVMRGGGHPLYAIFAMTEGGP